MVLIDLAPLSAGQSVAQHFPQTRGWKRDDEMVSELEYSTAYAFETINHQLITNHSTAVAYPNVRITKYYLQSKLTI